MILMLRGGVRGMERSMHDFVYANKGHRIINLILDLTSSLKNYHILQIFCVCMINHKGNTF